MPKMHTDACLIGIPTMLRYSSNLAGYITNKAIVSAVKSKQLSTWRNRSTLVRQPNRSLWIAQANTWQIKVMLKVGTCLAGATCHSKNTPRRTKHISKLSTVTGGTQPSGARLAFCITRLISTEMHWMHIPVRYA